jgi:hypothetical protein
MKKYPKKYSFCEPSTVTGSGHWCIRELTEEGPFFTGGVDTKSLCGRVDPDHFGGWDINVDITEHHLKHACPKCTKVYKSILMRK